MNVAEIRILVVGGSLPRFYLPLDLEAGVLEHTLALYKNVEAEIQPDITLGLSRIECSVCSNAKLVGTKRIDGFGVR